ncbi:Smr/MutS family protein [Propionivibrio sp.]|uniref:Smr/MutS family protein n=1 Tax=Propionivibrio sp. TaxID=2212460 RepID=UPI003BF2CA8F
MKVARDQPDPDDLAAFHAAVDGATPLRKADRITFDLPKPSPRPRQRELDEAAAIVESLHGPMEIDDLLTIGDADSFLRTGLPRSVLRDLRRGRWSIQRHIDLHGLNRHQAHEEVALFLAESTNAGKRCIRIVHGRGHGSPGREGILRQLVKNWLARRKDVLAFCHAPPCDGGNGALWVLLKSSQPAKRKSDEI